MKIILFLDEINTTNCLNLLVDLFTNNSFIGNSLKDNVYIIAACNPYRLALSKHEEIGYAKNKMHHIRNLIYTVNPLPLSLINYVFDFGHLREEEERKYISSFVQSFLSNSFPENKNDLYDEISKIVCDAIYTCQKFIRDNTEVSSVSLRDIKRFKKFFEFFLDLISQRKEFVSIIEKNESSNGEEKEDTINDKSKEKEKDMYLKVVNLSLYICYYLRIIDRNERNKLSKTLEKNLGFDFLKYPKEIEDENANNMNLKRGIAKNRALLDNILTLFVCLNAKIPVFICGKAGCS